MEYALADIWEAIADAHGDKACLVNGSRILTWSQFDRRASGLAAALVEAGLQPGAKVALYLFNCNEYLEATFAAFKFSGVPVNVNYRYQDRELAYLLDNADAEALVFDSALRPVVDALGDRLPGLKVLIEVNQTVADDGPAEYESCAASHPLPRQQHSPDDIILLYTGGTTGMPKGVMHRCGTLSAPFRRSQFQPESLDTVDDIVQSIAQRQEPLTFVVPPPLMHGVGWWSSMMCLTRGGCVVTLAERSFDPQRVWQTIEAHRATNLSIVGDAFAGPMADAYEQAAGAGRAYDISSLREVNSSGAIWSARNKQRFLTFADLMLFDAMGASEGGTARQITRRGDSVETSSFELNPGARVFTDDGREVAPGSGEVGMLATSNNVPLGYYKDEEKTRQTFREIAGVRYSFPGDYATIDADGMVRLLGRGSMCINSAGEKIYPGEVEEAIKEDARVADCAVVGIPDEKFGQAVAAVVELKAGHAATAADLVEAAKPRIASYKLPRTVVFTDHVARAPNGKVDYEAARRLMLEAPR